MILKVDSSGPGVKSDVLYLRVSFLLFILGIRVFYVLTLFTPSELTFLSHNFSCAALTTNELDV